MMNDAAAFYAGIVCGLPIGALLLAVLATVVTELGKQGSAKRATERYRRELRQSAESPYRVPRLELEPYTGGVRPLAQNVNRVRGRDVARRMGAVDK